MESQSLRIFPPSGLVSLVVVLIIALLFRIPYISSGMPFFYDEDEGHHYNRVVEMVKSGKFDPEYFRKPSLHFYLRMPVVAASFLWSVRTGELREVKEIKTRDNFGLAKYAYTASPDSMVKWNRAWSVMWSLAVVALTFLIAWELKLSLLLCTAASGIVAFSPALLADSAKIGVDTLMVLTTVLTVFLSLKLVNKFSFSLLIFSGIAAGLAVSSKYNALPIVVLPLIAAIFAQRYSAAVIIGALISPLLGFFIGTPFALFSLPLFLDQFAYEIWHYGVEGHVGHMAEPGWPQLIFYFKWLSTSGIGIITLSLGVLGFVVALSRGSRDKILLGIFPLLYLILMTSQKANFTRNILVLIPFIAVFGVFLLQFICLRLKSDSRIVLAFFSLAILVQPFLLGLSEVQATRSIPVDSRLNADAWLEANQALLLDTAVSGELLMPQRTFQRPGVQRFDPKTETSENLYLNGFDRVVTGASAINGVVKSSKEITFAGEVGEQRIIRNPAMQSLKLLSPEDVLMTLGPIVDRSFSHLITPPLIYLGHEKLPDVSSLVCYRDLGATSAPSSEGHCWLKYRLSKVSVEDQRLLSSLTAAEVKIELEVMTPWPKQELYFQTSQWKSPELLQGLAPGEWKKIALTVPLAELKANQGFYALISQVHSPKSQGINQDDRRLGLALKYLKVDK